MTAAAPSTALVTIQPAFNDAERLALARFLAGYRGLTPEAYTLDLRQFTARCRARSLSLFAVRRAVADSELGWHPAHPSSRRRRPDNREIAAHRSLSPRTVEYHLGKVFTKLRIASRTELIRPPPASAVADVRSRREAD
jgi:Bacterial regulatory proteins, luxR family